MIQLDPRVARTAMQVLYAGLKVLPTNRSKVLFLSRQSNSTPLDYSLLMEELEDRNPDVVIKSISRRLDKGFKNYLYFSVDLARSMFHLATSKVVVLDSYWPAVSVLEHKDDLVVFQMWHALGKIKQSGKITVGRPAGRDERVAKVMRIHDGYDYVVAGGKAWNQYYMDSFGVDEDSLLNIGLPRADYLVNNREEIARRIFDAYPELQDAPIVLYAPTYRKGGGIAFGAKRLVARLEPAGYNVIVKGHANQTLLAPDKKHWACPEFTALELLAVADYLVTDYSAIAIEAALIDVKTFYYVHDFKRYIRTNGLNLNVEKEMPRLAFRSTLGVERALKKPYPWAEYERFKEKCLFEDPGHSTRDLADALFEKGGLCTP